MNALASKEAVYIDYYNKVMHYVAGKIVNGQNGWQSGILRDEVGKGGILAKSGDCG